MFSINKEQYQALVLGASIYSTGGWIPYPIQIQKWESIFSKIPKLDILESEDLSDEDLICNIYGIGSASETDFDFKSCFLKGFAYLAEKYKYDIKAFFPAETNIESVVFEMSVALGISVFDADCTWGRAVPELKYDNFVIAWKSFLPCVAIDRALNVYEVEGLQTPEEIEAYLRSLCVQTWGSLAVIDHIVPLKEAKKLLTLWVLKRDLELWKLVWNASFDTLLNTMQAKELARGKIQKVALKDTWWFLSWEYNILSDTDEVLTLQVQNENMRMYSSYWELLVAFPTFLMLLDAKNFQWLHNGSLQVWQEVILLQKEAEERRKEAFTFGS